MAGPAGQKRLLVLNHNLTEHGTWFRAIKLAEGFLRQGYDVTMVSTGPGYYRPRFFHRSRSKARGPHGEQIQFYESPSWTFCHGPDGGWSPLGAFWRSLYFLFGSYDIVYSFSHKPVDFIPAWLLSNLRGAKWITDWCDLWGGDGLNGLMKNRRGPAENMQDRIDDRVTEVDAWFEKTILKRADLVTVISDFLYQQCRKTGVQDSKIYRLGSGAETEKISPIEKEDARKKLGIHHDGKILGYVTNWYPEEEFFLKAVNLVLSQRPDTILISTGPAFENIEKYIPDPDVRSRLRPLGRVPWNHIPLILGSSDVLLLPLADSVFNQSRWPHKIGDYLAAARPVVTCDVGDVAKLVGNEKVGRVTPPEPEAFATAILELLDSESEQEISGQRGREVAEEILDWDRIVDDLIQYVEQTVL